jgi:hypothetical protein
MGKAEIYSDIICLTNNIKKYPRREIELIIINIKNKCIIELNKQSEYNQKKYQSNPYKKELKAIANSKTAIRKAFKSRHVSKTSKRQIEKHIVTIRENQYLISKGNQNESQDDNI